MNDARFRRALDEVTRRVEDMKRGPVHTHRTAIYVERQCFDQLCSGGLLGITGKMFVNGVRIIAISDAKRSAKQEQAAR